MNHTKIIMTLSMILCTTALHGCSNKNYLNARSIPPLHIPPGITASGFSNDYPISNQRYLTNEKIVNIVPPDL